MPNINRNSTFLLKLQVKILGNFHFSGSFAKHKRDFNFYMYLTCQKFTQIMFFANYTLGSFRIHQPQTIFGNVTGQTCSQIKFFCAVYRQYFIFSFTLLVKILRKLQFWSSFAKHQLHFNLFVYVVHQKFAQITFWGKLCQTSAVVNTKC